MTAISIGIANIANHTRPFTRAVMTLLSELGACRSRIVPSEGLVYASLRVRDQKQVGTGRAKRRCLEGVEVPAFAGNQALA
jgi:hypothetical protein